MEHTKNAIFLQNVNNSNPEYSEISLQYENIAKGNQNAPIRIQTDSFSIANPASGQSLLHIQNNIGSARNLLSSPRHTFCKSK